jgi:hypothetical protein
MPGEGGALTATSRRSGRTSDTRAERASMPGAATPRRTTVTGAGTLPAVARSVTELAVAGPPTVAACGQNLTVADDRDGHGVASCTPSHRHCGPADRRVSATRSWTGLSPGGTCPTRWRVRPTTYLEIPLKWAVPAGSAACSPVFTGVFRWFNSPLAHTTKPFDFGIVSAFGKTRTGPTSHPKGREATSQHRLPGRGEIWPQGSCRALAGEPIPYQRARS